MTKLALKVELTILGVLSIMANIVVTSYLDRQLTTPVDGSLQGNQQHDEFPPVLTHPPGINTLTDWGRTKAPSGKHATRTFADLYENERGYVNQLWSRRAVSTWVRSFQLYCRERRASSQEHRRLHPEVETTGTPRSVTVLPSTMAPVAKAQASQPMAMVQKKGYPSADRQTVDEGWINIPVQTAIPAESKNHKRSVPQTEKAMERNPDVEKVAQLRAQIAILQRELDKETKGESSNKE